MSRIRSIKPEFFTDPKLGRLSAEERLFYVGLWTQCDDHGNCPGNAPLLKGQLCPYDAWHIPGILTALAGAGRVVPYATDDELYLHLPTFERHQTTRPDRKYKRFPAYSGDLRCVPDDAWQMPGTIQADTGLEVGVGVGVGVEVGVEVGVTPCSPPGDATPPRRLDDAVAAIPPKGGIKPPPAAPKKRTAKSAHEAFDPLGAERLPKGYLEWAFHALLVPAWDEARASSEHTRLGPAGALTPASKPELSKLLKKYGVKGIGLVMGALKEDEWWNGRKGEAERRPKGASYFLSVADPATGLPRWVELVERESRKPPMPQCYIPFGPSKPPLTDEEAAKQAAFFAELQRRLREAGKPECDRSQA